MTFPPAPGLEIDGKLDPRKFKADSPELQGQKLFFGKARCAECHPAPYYTDNSMHDLKVERFFNLVLETQLTFQEKHDLVAFLRQL